MMNLINILQDTGELCGPDGLNPILKIVGIVVLGIKIAVPIILIVVGMFDLAKAVGEKDEGKIKEAQQKLVKRAIAAVLVFLVITLVGILMRIINKNPEYKNCIECINHPFDIEECPQPEE